MSRTIASATRSALAATVDERGIILRLTSAALVASDPENAAAGAAQQIMSTLFWGSTTLSAEPFNTAGQTFLPDHYDPETPDVITPRFRLTLQRLLDSSLLWGLAITLGTYPLKSEKALSMFTTSKDVMRLVAIGPILAVGALIAPMLTAEGTLLCGNQNFTARSC